MDEGDGRMMKDVLLHLGVLYKFVLGRMETRFEHVMLFHTS